MNTKGVDLRERMDTLLGASADMKVKEDVEVVEELKLFKDMVDHASPFGKTMAREMLTVFNSTLGGSNSGTRKRLSNMVSRVDEILNPE